jgi:redox-regulated HSP33 family molecular chaperone
MIDGTLKLLAEKLEEERKIILESLGDGPAQDFAQYQNSAGIIRGLMIAQRHIADLAKHMEDDDE